MSLNQEMRHYLNILNEAKVDKAEARDVLAQISPTYAKVRGEDKLEEVSINKGALKSFGQALAFVAVAVGGVNVSMVGPVQAQAAQSIAQSISHDIQNMQDDFVADDGTQYSASDWQIDIEPVSKSDAGTDDQEQPEQQPAANDLESQVEQRMQQRIAEVQAQGVTVEHNYHDERHDQVPDEYTADYGPWEVRDGYANVPDRPSIVNLLVMEEEFAHALGSDESLYGKDPIHMLWEEFRAKHYARLKVQEVFELDAAARSMDNMTNQNYIEFARGMQQYTRQAYSDDLLAEIKADAEATAERQYESGNMSVENSGDKFAKYFAR